MPRYSLRTLLILMALVPPLVAGVALLPLWFTLGQSAGILIAVLALTGAVAGCLSLFQRQT